MRTIKTRPRTNNNPLMKKFVLSVTVDGRSFVPVAMQQRRYRGTNELYCTITYRLDLEPKRKAKK